MKRGPLWARGPIIFTHHLPTPLLYCCQPPPPSHTIAVTTFCHQPFRRHPLHNTSVLGRCRLFCTTINLATIVTIELPTIPTACRAAVTTSSAASLPPLASSCHHCHHLCQSFHRLFRHQCRFLCATHCRLPSYLPHHCTPSLHHYFVTTTANSISVPPSLPPPPYVCTCCITLPHLCCTIAATNLHSFSALPSPSPPASPHHCCCHPS